MSLKDVRDLVETNWKAMEFLATTKKNEATNPFGHTTTDKQGNVTLHEPVHYSLVGAIMRINGDRILLGEESGLDVKTLTNLIPSQYVYLSTWEGAKGRTKEDVLALLDKALS